MHEWKERMNPSFCQVLSSIAWRKFQGRRTTCSTCKHHIDFCSWLTEKFNVFRTTNTSLTYSDRSRMWLPLRALRKHESQNLKNVSWLCLIQPKRRFLPLENACSQETPICKHSLNDESGFQHYKGTLNMSSLILYH